MLSNTFAIVVVGGTLLRKYNMDDATLTQKLASWRAIQADGLTKLILAPPAGLDIKRVGAMDISYVHSDPDTAIWVGYACLTLCDYPSMEPYFQFSQKITVNEPYVSGYLAFREAPGLVQIYEQFRRFPDIPQPDVLLIDGNGVYHERGFGLACQVGLSLSIPTIGISKTPVLFPGLADIQSRCDTFWESRPHTEPMPIYGLADKFYGYALRGPTSKRPCYVSPGHLMSADLAIEIVKNCRAYQALEPIRLSDKCSRLLCGQGKA
jgi:deoxyinosine 3'endonuclease (endonuclease V)